MRRAGGTPSLLDDWWDRGGSRRWVAESQLFPRDRPCPTHPTRTPRGRSARPARRALRHRRRRAGRYRIIAAPVRGGTGEVYRADHSNLGHSVALKFLLAELARDHERLPGSTPRCGPPAGLSVELLNTRRGTGIALLQSPKNSPSTCPVNRWLRS